MSPYNRQRRLGTAREKVDGRAREELKCDHRRKRISRKSEEELSGNRPEYQRLARLNSHPVEEKLGTELSQSGLHQIVLARGDASGKQQQVARLQRLFDNKQRPVEIVWSNRRDDRLPARTDNLRCQSMRVRVPDLVRLRLLIDRNYLVTRCDHGNTRSGVHRNATRPHRSQRGNMTEVDARSLRQS